MTPPGHQYLAPEAWEVAHQIPKGVARELIHLLGLWARCGGGGDRDLGSDKPKSEYKTDDEESEIDILEGEEVIDL
jgi:hypothetical protein